MTTPMMTTRRVRVVPDSIPRGVTAVSWRRVKGENVWHYRFHATARGAKMAYRKYGRAYDEANFDERGWKILDDSDRQGGVWLW